jgi:tetratricopeptide (TPR) repeat protein
MMVAGIARGPELPGDAVEQIVARTDGIPLFVEELTKSIIESRRLVAGGEDEGAGHVSPQAAIPASLRSSLMARLDRRASAKEVAQIGAVIGRRFSYALLRCVAPLDEAALKAALDEFERSEMVLRRGVPPEATYTFKHALVQDAAYDSLPGDRRRAIHRLIAEALRDKFPALAETEPELVAQHFAHADIADTAWHWSDLAGQRALNRSAYVEAIAHFGKAIELADRLLSRPEQRLVRLRLQINYGQTLIVARGHGAMETTAAFARARELTADIENAADRLSIYYGLWVGSFARAELGPLRELAAVFLRETRAQPLSPEVGIAQRAVGSTAWFEGDYARAREALEAAAGAYARERDCGLALRFGQDSGVTAMIYLALVLWSMGCTRRARHLIEAAHASAGHSKHAPTMVFSHAHAAMFACLRGDAVEAAPHAEATTEMNRKHGVGSMLGIGTFCSGWACWQTGQRAEGLAAMREAWALVGPPSPFSPLFCGLLAAAEADAGDIEAGLVRLEDQIREIEQYGQRWFEAELHRLRGKLLARRGTANAAAEAAFLRSLEIAHRQTARTFELRAALELAKLYRSTGRAEAARTVLEPIHQALIDESDLAEIHEASNILAVLSERA